MTQENALPLEDTAGDDAQPIAIELEAHDVSRFEWCDKQGIVRIEYHGRGNR